MKRIFILHVLILVCFCIKAQINYFKNGTEWRQRTTLIGPACYYYNDHAYYLASDTVVGGKTYKKIRVKGEHTSEAYGPTPSCGTDRTYNEYRSSLRQEGRKIYELQSGGTEILAYDFDLNIGDTVHQGYYQEVLFGQVVRSIDTIGTGNDELLRFNFDSLELDPGLVMREVALVEGIGVVMRKDPNNEFDPLEGGLFIREFLTIDYGNSFICYSVEKIGYFPLLAVDCELNVSTHKRIIAEEMHYYPNPTSDFINIDIPDNLILSDIHIINNLGQIVKNFYAIKTASQIKLELEAIASGNYFVQMNFGNAGMATFPLRIN